MSMPENEDLEVNENQEEEKVVDEIVSADIPNPLADVTITEPTGGSTLGSGDSLTGGSHSGGSTSGF